MARGSQGKRLLTVGAAVDFDLWQICNMLPLTGGPGALRPSLLGLLEGQETRSVDESKA